MLCRAVPCSGWTTAWRTSATASASKTSSQVGVGRCGVRCCNKDGAVQVSQFFVVVDGLSGDHKTRLIKLQCRLGMCMTASHFAHQHSALLACPYCCCCHCRVCADESRPQQGARQGRSWWRQGWGWALWRRWQGQGRGWGWQGPRRQGQGRQGTRQGLKVLCSENVHVVDAVRVGI
jgi:hypothetical protein